MATPTQEQLNDPKFQKQLSEAIKKFINSPDKHLQFQSMQFQSILFKSAWLKDVKGWMKT